MNKVFNSNVRAYIFRLRPTSETSIKKYIDDQLLDVQHSTQSIQDAINALGQGVTSGTLIGLEATGVEPGTYSRATITIGADGRVSGIEQGASEESPLPVAPGSGLYLVSGAGGSYEWQTAPSSLPSGGYPGQVLTKTDRGTTWSTPTVAETTVPPFSIRSLYDLDISDGDTVGDGIFEAELRPTGVQAGTYTTATITVDSKGRILAAKSGETASDEAVRDGTYRYWRVMMPGGALSAPPEVGAVAFLEDAGGTDLGGVETHEIGLISRTFPEDRAVQAIKITATTAARAPSRVVLQGSINGGTYFDVWQATIKGWTDGEIRLVRRPGTVTLTGDVTGTGTDEIATTLAPTGVEAGEYRSPDVTVGADGRITAIANGTGSGGSFDPDIPLDYLTFKDQVTRDEIIATIESGAWVLTPAGIPMENGDSLAMEDGTGSIAPEA